MNKKINKNRYLSSDEDKSDFCKFSSFSFTDKNVREDDTGTVKEQGNVNISCELPLPSRRAARETEKIPEPAIQKKQLKDFYPLNDTDCEKLQSLSGRKFTPRAMNEILLDMSRKMRDRWFRGKKSFMKYMSIAFSLEKRNEMLVSGDTFRIRNNMSEDEHKVAEQEKYLTEIEYNRKVSPEWHFRKRMTTVIRRDLAYRLLKSLTRVESSEGIFRLYLSDHVGITELEREIILNQARSTHDSIDTSTLEFARIERLEIIMPDRNGSVKTRKAASTSVRRYEGLWGKIRQQLINYFGQEGEGKDRSWFGKLEADVDEEGRMVRLKAPTGFIRNFVEQNYGYLIERFLKMEQYGMVISE